MQLKDKLVTIAKAYGVKYRFDKKMRNAYAFGADGRIVVGCHESLSTEHVVSAFFHELAHVIGYRTGKYREYNGQRARKEYLRKYAVKAELYTDRVGRKLMKFHFPKMNYVGSYHHKWAQDWLKDYWGIENET